MKKYLSIILTVRCPRNIQSEDTKQGYCHEVWAGDFAAERTLRPHGHFSWNSEKNSNILIDFSDNEIIDCEPLKKYRNNQYPFCFCTLYLPYLCFGGWEGGGALIRGWALKIIILGGGGVGAHSRPGAY